MSFFVAEGICKTFGGLQALVDVDLEILRRKNLGLIGPNGSGKTTFVNCITGEYKPSKGRVSFNGENLTGLSSHIVSNRGLARTYQQTRLFYRLPVMENMKIASLNVVKNEDHKDFEIKEILQTADLWSKKDALGDGLTLFEQKKLEIAMRLVLNPQLLILDEPVSGMTSEEIKSMLSFIENMNNAYGVTLLIIEHTMKAITTLSDRVAVLNQGRKIADGSPNEVMKNEEVIKSYMGSGEYTKRFINE